MNKRKEKKNKQINGDKIKNNNISYNNETKYKEIQMNNNKNINNDHDNDNNNRKGFNKQLQKNSRLIFENVTQQSHVSKIQLEVQRFPFPITIIIYDHYYNFYYYYYYYYYLKFILLTQRYQNPSSLLLHSLNLFTFLTFFCPCSFVRKSLFSIFYPY